MKKKEKRERSIGKFHIRGRKIKIETYQWIEHNVRKGIHSVVATTL